MKILSALLLSGFITFTATSTLAKDGQGYMLSAGADFSLGNMSNKDKTIPGRMMNSLGLDVVTGWMFGHVGPAVYGEYRIVGQMDDPSERSNQNLRGSGYLLGIGAAGTYEKWSFGLFYDFIGVYNLSNSDSNGNAVDYSSPGGFNLMAGYEVYPKLSVNLVFGMVSYSKSALGSTDTDISSNKMTHFWYGLGAMYRIF